MSDETTKPLDEITVKRVYHLQSILFFSILFLILGAVLIYMQPKQNNLIQSTLTGYLGLGLVSLSSFGFGVLTYDYTTPYLSKSWKLFRNNFPKYKLGYAFFLLISLLLILIYLAYKNLSKETFWTVTVGFFGAGIVSAIGWVLIRLLFSKRK